MDHACFQLYVRHWRINTIEGVRQSDDVAHLLNAVEGKVGVPYSAVRLDYGGTPLQEGTTLAYYGLGTGSTVQLALRGRGGGCGASKTAQAAPAEAAEAAAATVAAVEATAVEAPAAVEMTKAVEAAVEAPAAAAQAAEAAAAPIE